MTQTAQILADLKRGQKLTPLDALDRYGCFRLGARIYDLRRKGHLIHSELIDVGEGKHVARYTLIKAAA